VRFEHTQFLDQLIRCAAIAVGQMEILQLGPTAFGQRISAARADGNREPSACQPD